MVVAVYQQDNNIVVNWGDTTPYHYDLFLVRFDKDGYNFLQEGPPFTHSRLAGSYSIPAPGVGTYTVIVEGCDGSDNVDCKQGWTIPASVHYTLLSSGNATPSCPHEAVGLIHDRWMDLGGADGPLGCPITDELAVPGRNGRSSTFEHGQIVWSPDQGPNMVVAVYQQDNNIVVDWGPTLPYHYNFWIARWDKDGQNVGQQDICKSGEPACQFVTPTGGTWNVPLSDADRAAAHTYTVVIEGCDEATFGSDCKQGWTIPASVQYEPPSPSPYVIDLSSAGATTPLLARLTIPKRAKVVSSYNACRGKVLGEVVGDEGDFMVVAIAKLYMAELAMRFHTPRGCPGSLVDFRSEVNDAIRKLGQEPSYTGSSSDRIPCRRRGEYDVALKGYIIMMYRFHDLLDPDVRFRILHLLTKNGPYDPDDESYCSPINIPETENHLLLIHTSRYLTNQLLYNAYKDEGPLYQTYHIDHYNNNANGMTTFMLQYLRVFLMGDFKEYNARPYQHYSAAALQNLYDFAQDQSVKTAAQMVLDYISAKFAVSSNFLRRSAPFRRRASHYATNLLDQRSDAQTNRFLLLTGMTQILGEVKPVLHAHQGARDDMQLLAASTYQAPDMILDLIMNQDHRHFYQRIRHEGVEIYSSERDFLISAGGFWMGSPYSVAGGEDPDDQGVAIPTTLMPTGEGTDLQQFVRIDGAGTVPADDNGDGTVYTVENGNRIPQRNRVNTGVAPHFACGINPVIPDAYLPQDKPDCYRVVGPWTFLDHSSESCVGRRDYGFYAAVFRARTGNTSYGFFEARGRHESQGLSFEQFVETVQAQNSDRQFAYGAVNVYTTSTGRDIKFEFNPPGDNKYIWPILSTGDPNIDQTLDRGLPSWPLAQGDVINSDGPGRITIDNPFLGKRLVLDHRDSLRPKRIETSIHGHVGAGDIPVPGDYDSDGIIDSAFWRPGEGTWHIQPSSGGLTRIDHFGQVGDYPVPADYDHDGKTDLAVWRPSDGTWYVQPSSGGPIWQRTTGRDGAIVVPSDHDGLFILARTLVVLAQQLAAAGQTSEAAEPARGGIGIFLRLAPQVSDALVLDIVWQVGINSGYLPPAEAVEPVQQVVVLAQQLADRNPTNTEYRDRLMWIRNVLTQRLAAASHDR